ncbi:hypothetical protein [Thermoactinospora rubra]|uniref:hypothetical protein n=1 Tax=Thermoactinospora rubra TaxID=1088767 RepID=UPI000A1153D2|nr:hypothetical protein [Thermoactinospora rubra]
MQPGDIKQRYPRWSIWQSDLGRWWATRRGGLDGEAINRGCSTTVDADDLEQLTARLAAEEKLNATVTDTAGR